MQHRQVVRTFKAGGVLSRAGDVCVIGCLRRQITAWVPTYVCAGLTNLYRWAKQLRDLPHFHTSSYMFSNTRNAL